MWSKTHISRILSYHIQYDKIIFNNIQSDRAISTAPNFHTHDTV